MVMQLHLLPFYTLCILYLLDPEEFEIGAELAVLRIQLFFMRCYLTVYGWTQHRRMVRLAKELGFPHPGRFRVEEFWVDPEEES